MKIFRRLCPGLCLLFASACATADFSAPPFADRRPPVASGTAASYLKARLAAREQQLDLAADAYARTAARAPQSTRVLRHAFYYELVAGQFEEALAHAAKLTSPEYAALESDSAASDPSTVLALPELVLAADAIRDGRYPVAREHLVGAKGNAFTHSIAWQVEAWILFDTEGPQAAISHLDKTPEDLFAGFVPVHRAFLQELAGDNANATLSWQAAVGGFKGDNYIIPYAEFLLRSGQQEDAASLFREMTGHGGYLQRAGRLGLARLGQPVQGEAAAFIRQKGRTPPPAIRRGSDGAALVFYDFAQASYDQARSEMAAASMAGFRGMKPNLNTPLALAQIALALDPDYAPANYLAASIYADYDLHDKAIEAFERVPFEDPVYPFAVIGIAASMEANGETAKALARLQAFQDRDPATPETGLVLADYYSEAKEFGKADTVLTDAIQTASQFVEDPAGEATLWRYYFARGATRTEGGNWTGAEADLKKALELSPEQPLVMNYLGYSWAERGENLDEAFDLIDRALDQRPNSGAITDSLGWAYFMLGEYDEAIIWLERAVRLEPADATLASHLGDAYWQMGRATEARYEWQRAFDLEEDEALKQALQDKIRNGLSVN